MPVIDGRWTEDEIYYITIGFDGPVVEGPYGGERVAELARSSLPRSFSMWWRRQHYHLTPKDCLSDEQRAARGIRPSPPRER